MGHRVSVLVPAAVLLPTVILVTIFQKVSNYFMLYLENETNLAKLVLKHVKCVQGIAK